uniref:Uncharacterized protein n=1 Tax=Arundo donax TaxID=35708 RepID=A0A0A9A1U0_ARUDO
MTYSPKKQQQLANVIIAQIEHSKLSKKNKQECK